MDVAFIVSISTHARTHACKRAGKQLKSHLTANAGIPGRIQAAMLSIEMTSYCGAFPSMRFPGLPPLDHTHGNRSQLLSKKSNAIILPICRSRPRPSSCNGPPGGPKIVSHKAGTSISGRPKYNSPSSVPWTYLSKGGNSQSAKVGKGRHTQQVCICTAYEGHVNIRSRRLQGFPSYWSPEHRAKGMPAHSQDVMVENMAH